MIVIHPQDRTTQMLSILYRDCPDVRLVDQSWSKHEINHLLHAALPREQIMLLGHGGDKGLFSRPDSENAGFDRIIVGHQQAYYLRPHCLIGVFCHANLFAENEHLHGLFTGMFISEMHEAEEYGIVTSQQELDQENDLFMKRLRALLDEKVRFSEIPGRMKLLDQSHTPLTEFNYHSLFYL